MTVIEIQVSYGQTFNDDFEQFRNHRPQVSLKAHLEEGESYDEKVAVLQERCRQHLALEIKRIKEMREAEQQNWKKVNDDSEIPF